MMEPNCFIHIDDALGRRFVPFLCVLYDIANNGHAFEDLIEIPNWMRWYSTPDQYLFQLWEAGLLLLLSLFMVSLWLARVLDRRGFWSWDCMADARYITGIALMAKLGMWLVSLLNCQAGCVLENVGGTDQTAF